LRETLTFWTEAASWDRRSRSRGGQRARSGRSSSYRALSAAPLCPSRRRSRESPAATHSVRLSWSVPWPAGSGSRQLRVVRRVRRRHQQNGSTRSSLSFFFSDTYMLPLFVPANDIRRSFCPVNGVGILWWLGYIRARFWARWPVEPEVEVGIGLGGEGFVPVAAYSACHVLFGPARSRSAGVGVPCLILRCMSSSSTRRSRVACLPFAGSRRI